MHLMTLSITLIMFFTASSFAAGPSTGGGGDIVRLPDDSVVLADPFLDHGDQQPNNMPPLRALNPRLLQAANVYNLALKLVFKEKNDVAAEIEKLTVRSSNLRFYAVKNEAELNQFCAAGGRKTYTLPSGVPVQKVACTAGAETFLVEAVFEKLSLRQQVLLLIHERLTTLRDENGGKNFSAIARFITGIDSFLTVLKEQNSNKYRRLSSQEVNNLTEFYYSADEINLRNANAPHDAFQVRIQPLGGGRISEDSVAADSALIDIESSVTKSSRVGEKSEIKKSQLVSTNVENDVKVSASTLLKSSIGERSVIENSQVRYINSGKNLFFSSVNLLEGWEYYKKIYGIKDSEPKMAYVADNQSLSSQTIRMDTYLFYAPEGYSYKFREGSSFSTSYKRPSSGSSGSKSEDFAIENLKFGVSFVRKSNGVFTSGSTDSQFLFTLSTGSLPKKDLLTISPEGEFKKTGLTKVIHLPTHLGPFFTYGSEFEKKLKEHGIVISYQVMQGIPGSYFAYTLTTVEIEIVPRKK
ncbi:hypothetical protein D3C87_257060 [compost metagenome]